MTYSMRCHAVGGGTLTCFWRRYDRGDTSELVLHRTSKLVLHRVESLQRQAKGGDMTEAVQRCAV